MLKKLLIVFTVVFTSNTVMAMPKSSAKEQVRLALWHEGAKNKAPKKRIVEVSPNSNKTRKAPVPEELSRALLRLNK